MTSRQSDEERLLRDRIAADPNDASAWGELARLIGSQRGRKREAVELWQRHLQLVDSARLADARLALGLAQIEARLDREAIATLQQCVADEPGNIEALCTLGELLRRSGEVEAAAAAFRSAGERDPDSIRARVGLLDCLDALGLETEAQAVLQALQQRAVADPAIAALVRELVQRRER